MWFVLLTALLWGVTNPLLKRYSQGMRQSGSALDDFRFLLRRPKYLAAQAANLLGSVAFFLALREVDVSTGAIAANSLAFVITVIVSVWVLREGSIAPRTYAGMALVLLGTAVCTVAKA